MATERLTDQHNLSTLGFEHVIALSWKEEMAEVLGSLLQLGPDRIYGLRAEYVVNGEYEPESRSANPTEVVLDKLGRVQKFQAHIGEILSGRHEANNRSHLLGWLHHRISQALAFIDKKIYINAENLVKNIFQETLFYTADVVAQHNGKQLERKYDNTQSWAALTEAEQTLVWNDLEQLYGKKSYMAWQVSLGVLNPRAETHQITASLPIVFEADVPPLMEFLRENPEFIEPRANTLCKLAEILEKKGIPIFMTIGDSTRITVEPEVAYCLIVAKAPLSLDMLLTLLQAESNKVNLAPFVSAFL